jgi:hypothetical protein
MADGVLLRGGYRNRVERVDDTVRRTQGDRAEYVHEVLGYLEDRGWTGAPRYLGVDDAGREILSYIEGHVAWDTAAQPDDVWAHASLAQGAALLRELHDLTEGTPLADGAEVVCHNDLSPRNTVYDDRGEGLRPVAFIDWDLAAPGRRIDDLAQMCWQYTGLGQARVSAIEAGGTLRVICDGYGLRDRTGVVDAVLQWQDRCWRGMRELADSGDERMVELREHGVIDDVHAAHAWVAEHRGVLKDALR